MRYVYTCIGVFASLVLLAVSAGMNYRFGYQLGNTPWDSLLLGSASAAVDGLKAVVPFFIGYAALRGHRTAQLLGSAAWILFTVYSLSSAIGFSSVNRAETTGKREIHAKRYHDLRKEIRRVERRLRKVGDFEPVGVLNARIDGLKVNRRWKSTKGCTNATVIDSIEFCKKLKAEEAKLGFAKTGTALETQLVSLKKSLSKYKDASALSAADPQAKALSFFTGIEVEWVKYLLVALVALVSEAGSGLGLYLSLHHLSHKGRSEEEEIHHGKRSPVAQNGRVTTFAKECLTGDASGPGLSMAELYHHYQDWCLLKRLGTEDYNNFSMYFVEVARHVNLEIVEGRFVGIRVKRTEAQPLESVPVDDSPKLSLGSNLKEIHAKVKRIAAPERSKTG